VDVNQGMRDSDRVRADSFLELSPHLDSAFRRNRRPDNQWQDVSGLKRPQICPARGQQKTARIAQGGFPV